MKINTVSVHYSELRSKGFPHYSNRTCGIELTAALDSGDTAVIARDRLFQAARLEVGKMFTEAETRPAPVEEGIREMTIPF